MSNDPLKGEKQQALFSFWRYSSTQTVMDPTRLRLTRDSLWCLKTRIISHSASRPRIRRPCIIIPMCRKMPSKFLIKLLIYIWSGVTMFANFERRYKDVDDDKTGSSASEPCSPWESANLSVDKVEIRLESERESVLGIQHPSHELRSAPDRSNKNFTRSLLVLI